MNMVLYTKDKIRKSIGALLVVVFRNKLNKGKEVKAPYAIFRFISMYSIDSYLDFKYKNENNNINRIRNKDVIKLAFVLYSSSMWNLDGLYSLLMKDNRFDVEIIVSRIYMKEKKASEIEYKKTLDYFNKNGYVIREAKDSKPYNYDVMFFLTPDPLADRSFNISSIPLKTLLFHTSYGYMLAGNAKKLDYIMYHWVYRYYTDTNYYRLLVSKSKLYSGNAHYLGFPKMDRFYDSKTERKSDKCTIIYAPHHSVCYKAYKSSTFDENYLAILELARKYSESTYWIYKPHPLLRSNSVIAGVFNNVEEYDEYEDKWRGLENGEVISSGDYFSIFKGSDAMITDSVSFLAEYQFSHKPLLLLESGKEIYNEFGKNLVEILYKCPGRDIDAIERFVRNVVCGIDEMKEVRDSFFKENIDYMQGGETANAMIYKDIKKIFE